MLQVNERLGDFAIIRLLGKGGMGEVYEARQFNPDRPVALKVLSPWLAQDEESLRRFWREAQVPANLDHPGIVRIISTGKTEAGVAYYTMHLVRGISLAEMIRRAAAGPLPETVTQVGAAEDTSSKKALVTCENSPAPVPEPEIELSPPMVQDYVRDRFGTVARIGSQAARALAYAHRQGFLHRDIKPSNLMVDCHSQVYLVDFGLTRDLGPAGNGTHPGVVPGTIWYMSPEQADSKRLDARTDLYSLGVTLYELATQGLGPFTARRGDREAVLEQVRAGLTMPLRALVPEIPPALEQIIRKAMHFQPDQRYADAAALARDLEAFLEPSPVPGAAAATPPRPDLPRRRQWSLVLAGAGCGLVLLGAVLLALSGPGPGSREETPTRTVIPVHSGKRALDGRNAYPESLRTHQTNVQNPLMKVNWVPLWSERVYGSGEYRTPGQQLELSSPLPDRCTILALADPDRPCFEFTLELNQFRGNNKPGENELGIVFGWSRQPEDPDNPPRFFVVQLDERPTDEDERGRLTIGTAWLLAKQGARAAASEWFRPLPEGKGTLPLDKRSGPFYPWRTLKVTIQGERVAVGVDQVPPREFTLTWLREKTRGAALNLHTTGAVGVWASRGRGFFRKATLTLLRAD